LSGKNLEFQQTSHDIEINLKETRTRKNIDTHRIDISLMEHRKREQKKIYIGSAR
jgi:hypothetical protein